MENNQFNNIFSNFAQEDFSKIEKDCLYNMGVKNFQLKNFSKALAVFIVLVQRDATNSLYVKALAGCLQAMNDYASALFTYKFAYTLDPAKNSDCLFFCGVCLYELEQYEEAKIEFDKCLNIANNITDEMKNKNNLYLKAIENQLAKASSC